MAKKRFTPELLNDIKNIFLSLQFHTFYSILGLKDNATGEEIKNSYFVLSRDFHPDTYLLEDCEEGRAYLENILSSITRAYQNLSDPEKRKKYDAYIEEKRKSRSYLGPYASEIIASVSNRIRKITGEVPSFPPGGASSPEPVQERAPEQAPEPAPPQKTFDSSILRETAKKHDRLRKMRLISKLKVDHGKDEEKK